MIGMMPRDLYRLRTVGDPRLSPDGSTVAFTVTTLDEGSNAPLGAIWVVPTDGSEPPRRVTSGTARDATPRWSPDGRSLAFTSNRDGQDTMQLYVIPWARSGEPRRLTHLPESVTAPSWSPDGTRLAFVARVRDPAYGEEDDRAREPRRITRLSYRLDDEGWTFDRPQHLFVVSADGSGEPTQLTDGDHEDESPAWSPDGRRVVFTSARHPDWDLTTIRDLYVVDADEPGEPRRLTAGEGSFALPSWSPDGGAIASLLTPGDMDEPRHARVAVTDVATGETTIRTGELDRTAQPFPAVREPAWRDDGSLVFAIEDRGTVALWQVPADGGTGATPLVAPKGACVSGCDTPPRGEPVVARTTPVEPPDLFAGDRRLTTFGREDGEAIGSASPERFTVETTAGPIDAWPTAPHGPQHPRRTVRAVRGSVLRRVPDPGGRRLRRPGLQPPWLLGSHRSLGSRDPRSGRGRSWMGNRGRRRRHGGARRRDRAVRRRRSRSPGGDGRVIRRLHDLVDRGP
jgi:dipeptidyl aminopeptidase/acylaminoacyl peptidase